MSDNKYYTPTIEEFHFGFEYEIFEDFDVHKEKSWHKQVYGENGYDQESIDHVSPNDMGKVRVKYLDQSDIESEGWKGADAPTIPQNHNSLFQIEKHLLAFNRFNRHCVIELYCDTRKENYVAFVGTLRNINELRTVMRMIGIDKT